MAISNTITYSTGFDPVLQARLDRPQTWKEVCEVVYTADQIIRRSYMSTTPSVQTVTRGTGHAAQTFAETSNTLTINNGRDLGFFVDWADLGQSPWTKGVDLFDRLGALLNEYVETLFLSDHASWTDFGVASIGGGGAATDPITVSASNIDDIIRGVKREIRENNGSFYMNRSGVAFVWRAADFEYLEAFVQANGFTTADDALKEGTVEGLHYLGADHYWSNDHAANHVFAGVKKQQMIGVLNTTYGRAHTIEFPTADTNTFLSGVAFYSRVDAGTLAPGGVSTILFDVNVS